MYSAIGASAEITADAGVVYLFKDVALQSTGKLCKQRTDIEALRDLFAHTKKPKKKGLRKAERKTTKTKQLHQTNFEGSQKVGAAPTGASNGALR